MNQIAEQEMILEISDLHVAYQSENTVFRAVNGIHLCVGKQETLGLVGETGAGKTTTALAIMRLLPERTGRISEGAITYMGENLLEKTKVEMRKIRGSQISMIFQDPMSALNPVMTVGDQILESLEIHSHKKDGKDLNARVDELMTLVGIPPSRKVEYPHQFSGGMKQRIVIAIALACEPQLLIADEPTTALDVTIQAQILHLMETLKQKMHTSMIMITHDLGVIAQTCDKVAVMYAGEIVEYGTLEDIFTGEKHHPYTKGLFGAIPKIDSNDRRLHPIDGLMPDPSNLPEGCKFHPRCPLAKESCKNTAPLRYCENGHEILCSLYGEGCDNDAAD